MLECEINWTQNALQSQLWYLTNTSTPNTSTPNTSNSTASQESNSLNIRHNSAQISSQFDNYKNMSIDEKMDVIFNKVIDLTSKVESNTKLLDQKVKENLKNFQHKTLNKSNSKSKPHYLSE